MSQPTSAREYGQRILIAIFALLAIYFLVAYVIIPQETKHYARQHPAWDSNPRITLTGDKHPGDPLNVALIGTEEEITRAMQAAKWYPANPLGLKSDVKIAVDTVLERPYDQAPVSNLFLFGRKEDLAFEQPVGDDPRKRHHVRFWKDPANDVEGKSIWFGSATYDERVGLSHTTGQITHHISGDVDVERDHIMNDLKQAGQLAEEFMEPGFHKELSGRNGGGDLWHTDGALAVGVLAEK